MRRLLFLVLMLPLAAGAQVFELKLTGGIAFNNKWRHSDLSATSIGENSRSYNPFSGLSLAVIEEKNFDYGISVENQNLRSKIEWRTLGPTGGITDSMAKINYGSPMFHVSLFGNYKIKVHSTKFYGGIKLGVISSFVKNDSKTIKTFDRASGYLVGGQVGFEQRIAPRLYLGAEVSPRYDILEWKIKGADGTYHDNVFILPVVLQVGYRF